MVQEDGAVDVVDFPPPKSLLQVLKEALGEQPKEFAAAALLAGSLAGQDADAAVWWGVLAKQLGIDDASSLPQRSLVQQQSGLQMLCDPGTIR